MMYLATRLLLRKIFYLVHKYFIVAKNCAVNTSMVVQPVPLILPLKNMKTDDAGSCDWLDGSTCSTYTLYYVSLLQVFGDSDEEDLPETQVVGGAQTEERVSCSYMPAVL